MYIYMYIYILKYHITNAPTCFGASKLSSGRLDLAFTKDGAEASKHVGVFCNVIYIYIYIYMCICWYK